MPGFGPKLPPFYSAAEMSRAGSTAFLFNDVSGAVHLLEGNSHKMLIGARDWGSDIAAVRSGCGAGHAGADFRSGMAGVGFNSRLRDHGPRGDAGERTLELRRNYHGGVGVGRRSVGDRRSTEAAGIVVMKRTVSRWFAVVSLLLAVLVPAMARTRPRYGGILHIETRSDPLKSPDGVARRLLFDTLTAVNDKRRAG